jgi:cation transport regulator
MTFPRRFGRICRCTLPYNAWTEYQSRGPEQRERTAHRVAWAAVERKYRKSGERWISRQSS